MSDHLLWVKLLVAAAVLLLSGLAALPLRLRPDLRGWAVAALGFLPFAGLHHFSLTLMAVDFYRGDSSGFEITAVDCLVVALFFALPQRRPGPYRLPRALYLGAVLLSLPFAAVPVYSLFSLWKLLRMYALVLVVARACEDPAGPPMLLRGMGLGALLQGALTLDEHYRLHRYQAAGAFDHQNTLGMACALIAPVAFAIVLARPRSFVAWGALAGSALAVLLSLSRGSLLMMALALAIVFAISAKREMTARKAWLAVGGLAAGALLAVRVWETWWQRFLHAPPASAESRVLFERAASLMLSDHPLGLGINQFSWALQNLGYGERAGITGYDAGAVVHNIYWLTAAELGFAGLAAYLLLLAAPLWTAALHGLRAKDDLRGDVLIGCAAGLLVTYAHGTLEWVARQTSFACLFWMIAAMVAGLSRQLEGEPAEGGLQADPMAA